MPDYAIIDSAPTASQSSLRVPFIPELKSSGFSGSFYKLVNLMEGRIWVESIEGQGSSFFFTALFGIGANAKTYRQTETIDIKDLRVLIVDDNSTYRLILNKALSSWGADITEASDGRAGLNEIRRATKAGLHFDLILLDCRMPNMDGFEFVRETAE